MELDLMLRRRAESGAPVLDKEPQRAAEKFKPSFERDYQKWYTQADAVIRLILPSRLPEFELLYRSEGKRKAIDAQNYSIQDWLLGLRVTHGYPATESFDHLGCAASRLSLQRKILESARAKFDGSLLDIRHIVQADLFDSELDAARELLKHGFLRPAGVVAGVVLERHLSHVCLSHDVRSRKQNPTLSDFNDLLKNKSVIDIILWRKVQHLGDLRNLCAHDKERDPTKEEVLELIDGAGKITKTLV
ncbi:MAG TPA: hypothetical protein VGB22_02280 [candidate division Zixibacteria bacterium]|jgi:hypothetical protein